MGTIAAMGMQAAGVGLGAFGQYQAGKAQESAARYNAQVLEREAQAREQKTIFESRQQAAESSRLQSTLQAGFGSSGAVASAGAPLAVVAEQARQSEMENLLIGYGGMTEAQQLRSQAKQQIYAGQVARQAGGLGAMTTLLTGFGGMAANYASRPQTPKTPMKPSTGEMMVRYGRF